MKICDLYNMLEIPQPVVDRLNSYEKQRSISVSQDMLNRILNRSTWDDAIVELGNIIGDDPDGINILWELLNIICSFSYPQYLRRNISSKIFVDTMKFCTRFLNDHLKDIGNYGFDVAYWFPRQISLSQFRIGALEYEFVNEKNKEISLHIPSDADLSTPSVLQSLNDFYCFRDTYYPEWKGIALVCDSWMLSPTLNKLLPEGSKILTFKNMFEIEKVDKNSTSFMRWIYPGFETIDENLPEKTSLQRKTKAHLLTGKNFGAAKGYLKEVYLK